MTQDLLPAPPPSHAVEAPARVDPALDSNLEACQRAPDRAVDPDRKVPMADETATDAATAPDIMKTVEAAVVKAIEAAAVKAIGDAFNKSTLAAAADVAALARKLDELSDIVATKDDLEQIDRRLLTLIDRVDGLRTDTTEQRRSTGRAPTSTKTSRYCT